MPQAIIERRFIAQNTAVAERRSADGVTKPGFTGYASVFNTESLIGQLPWGFRETWAPGCFTKTLNESDVVALCDHDMAKPLSRQSAGTLTLEQDDHGLSVDSDVPETTYGQDLLVNLENKNVAGMSVGFRVIKDAWEICDDGSELRTIMEVQLIEVSTTAFPAFTDTEAGARAVDMRSVALARTVRSMRSTSMDGSEDDDPGVLAQAADAAVDEAMALISSLNTEDLDPDLQQALALVAAADAALDSLLIALGVPDADEVIEDDPADGRDRSTEPADATRNEDNGTEPPAGTRYTAEHLRLRMSALSAFHGLPEPTNPKE